jgi:uncharacterized integral membrane protein
VANGHHPSNKEVSTMKLTTVNGQAAEAGKAAVGVGAVASGSGIAALLVFIVQNTADVSVTFLFWTFTWPVWLLIVVSAVLGAAIWMGLGILRRRRRRRARREARRS